MNVADVLQFMKHFSCRYYTSAKPHSSMSMAVATSTMADVTELAKKTIHDKRWPSKNETLVVTSKSLKSHETRTPINRPFICDVWTCKAV